MNIPNIPRLTVPDTTYRWWALGVTIIGGFMSILDTSIVNIAIPKMMAVFSVDSEDAQWILTAYMLTMGVLQPITGYFCDVFGTRRMYLLSLAAFTAGSALCGIAWSNDSMIFFRIIQAVGGGLIIPVTMTIVYQVFPVKERNMALAIWGISAMVAPAVGPTLSGYLTEYWDWRLIFTVNIPVGIIGYVMAALVLRETVLHKDSKFDFGGFVTSALGLFCLLLALSKGVDDGWTSPYIVALLYVAVASLTLFVAIELNHANPIMDLRLFQDRNFACSSMVIFLGCIGLFGGLFLIPLFMENLRDYSAMQTGIMMLPAAVASGLMMPVAAKLADRFGAKPVVVAGVFFLGLSCYPLASLDMDTTYRSIELAMILRGMGLGLFMMPVTVLGMNTVPLAKISRASSLNNTIRQVSGSLGIALLSTMLQNRQIYHLATNAEQINVASFPTKQAMVSFEGMLWSKGTPPAAAKHMLTYIDNLYNQAGVAPGLLQQKAMALINMVVQRQSLIFAFDDAFFFLMAMCFVALVPALLLKPAKSKGGAGPVMMD
ncbi:MAG: DHA2 family efflux MFS transporter permease subunit [Negativicutes bacterium]|nr:DHA2 family efflux MFS transporter permease subunit [Negativicutes bacterium]